jgi:hypothetical protein
MGEYISTSSASAPFIRMLRAIDESDWPAVRDQMADEVRADYESLSGEPAETVAADDLVARWRQMLSPLDATQHLLGAPEVAVRDDRAEIWAAVRGYHIAGGLEGGEEWMVAGQYIAQMSRVEGEWKLSALRLDMHYQTGNLELVAQAGARAAEEPTTSS